MMVVLSAPVSILNPNPVYSPLPLIIGVLYLNRNVPLLIRYNIITFLVLVCMVRWHYLLSSYIIIITIIILSNYYYYNIVTFLVF